MLDPLLVFADELKFKPVTKAYLQRIDAITREHPAMPKLPEAVRLAVLLYVAAQVCDEKKITQARCGQVASRSSLAVCRGFHLLLRSTALDACLEVEPPREDP